MVGQERHQVIADHLSHTQAVAVVVVVKSPADQIQQAAQVQVVVVMVDLPHQVILQRLEQSIQAAVVVVLDTMAHLLLTARMADQELLSFVMQIHYRI
jgi:hypothetical protein